MIVGTFADLQEFKQKHAENPDRIKAVEARLEWIVPDKIWYIRGEKDSFYEAAVVRRIKSTGKIPKFTWNGKQGFEDPDKRPELIGSYVSTGHLRNVQRVETKQRVKSPPSKKPPTFWKKVASYWKAINGPKVNEETFQKRLSKCTREGGYTWAPIDGKVESITPTSLTINGQSFNVPADETLKCKVGDEVKRGQTLATGEVAKPCPLLLTKVDKNGNTNYFCNGCGCGVRTKAELRSKLYYSKVTCPRTPPQFEDESNHPENLNSGS